MSHVTDPVLKQRGRQWLIMWSRNPGSLPTRLRTESMRWSVRWDKRRHPPNNCYISARSCKSTSSANCWSSWTSLHSSATVGLTESQTATWSFTWVDLLNWQSQVLGRQIKLHVRSPIKAVRNQDCEGRIQNWLRENEPILWKTRVDRLNRRFPDVIVVLKEWTTEVYSHIVWRSMEKQDNMSLTVGLLMDPSYPKLAPQWDCLDSVGENLQISSSAPVHSFEDRAEWYCIRKVNCIESPLMVFHGNLGRKDVVQFRGGCLGQILKCCNRETSRIEMKVSYQRLRTVSLTILPKRYRNKKLSHHLWKFSFAFPFLDPHVN